MKSQTVFSPIQPPSKHTLNLGIKGLIANSYNKGKYEFCIENKL